MVFCNLVGEEVVKKFERGGVNRIPFINTVVEDIDPKSHVGFVNGNLATTTDPSVEDIFALPKYDGDPEKRVLDTQVQWGSVKDTKDNPLIVVLAKSISFYVGVKTTIRFLYISSEYVLVELVTGACQFEMGNGNFVQMERCCSSDLSTKKLRNFSGKDLIRSTINYDVKGDYDYSRDAICAVRVNLEPDGYSFKSIEDWVYIFDKKNIEASRIKMDKKRSAYEKAKIEKEVRNKQLQAEYNKMQAEREAAKLAEEEEKEKKRKEREARKAQKEAEKAADIKKPRKRTSKDFLEEVEEVEITSNGKGRNAGADAFLKAVRGY